MFVLIPIYGPTFGYSVPTSTYFDRRGRRFTAPVPYLQNITQGGFPYYYNFLNTNQAVSSYGNFFGFNSYRPIPYFSNSGNNFNRDFPAGIYPPGSMPNFSSPSDLVLGRYAVRGYLPYLPSRLDPFYSLMDGIRIPVNSRFNFEASPVGNLMGLMVNTQRFNPRPSYNITTIVEPMLGILGNAMNYHLATNYSAMQVLPDLLYTHGAYNLQPQRAITRI